MTTRSEDFAGLSVAMVTPFRNNKVDYESLAQQIEFQIQAGTTALVPTGTTGESPTLSYEEHHQVVEEVVRIAAGRIKVMAGTGSNSTEEALSITKRAAKSGVDAVLVVSPYYNKPMQEGLYQHFKVIAESVEVPVCLYNIPSRTGRLIELDTIIRLSAIKNITMVKEATGSMDMATQIAKETDLTILSGDDSLTLPFMSVGARGAISVIGNIVPQDVIAMIHAFDANNMAEALRLHQKMFALSKNMLSLATNPIPIKAAMKILGLDTGELRLPLTSLDDNSTEKLKITLKNYGLTDN